MIFGKVWVVTFIISSNFNLRFFSVVFILSYGNCFINLLYMIYLFYFVVVIFIIVWMDVLVLNIVVVIFDRFIYLL